MYLPCMYIDGSIHNIRVSWEGKGWFNVLGSTCMYWYDSKQSQDLKTNKQ